MSKLLKSFVKKNKYHDHNIKYQRIETITYLFENDDEDYSFYPINHQQYQSFSSKVLLTLNEYLDKIRSEFTKLMGEDSKVKLSVNTVFRSAKNFNDKRTLCIKSNSTTDIDKKFDQLIKRLV